MSISVSYIWPIVRVKPETPPRYALGAFTAELWQHWLRGIVLVPILHKIFACSKWFVWIHLSWTKCRKLDQWLALLGLALLEIYLDFDWICCSRIKHTIYIFGIALLAFLRFLVQMWYIACTFGIGLCSMNFFRKKKTFIEGYDSW